MTNDHKRGDDSTVDRALTALAAIKGIVGKRRGVSDTIDCPNGCGGRMSYSVARSNGHVMARCSSPGCVAFMQ
jgi:hypothetical protein